MILYIDTTDFNNVVYALSDGKTVKQKSYKIDPHQSDKTISKLEEFLGKSYILNPKSYITKIIVNKGPGSYTGVRVGVTHALALGFAWDVPVHPVRGVEFIKLFKNICGQ